MYHDIPEASVETWLSKIVPQAFGSINTPISYSPLADTLYTGRAGYVFCGNDRILPLETQEYLCDIAGITNRTIVPRATHAFFVSACRETADAIDSFSNFFMRQ